MPPSTPEASLPGITGLLDRVHSALRGIDAADTTTVIPDRQLDAVSDAVSELEAFCRRHGIALSEWAGKLPEAKSDWLPIETAPIHWDTLHNEIVVAKFWVYVDEDGEAKPPAMSWAHVAYRTCDGWQVGTGGFKGINGFASFRLCDATHWMRLPTPPVSS